MVHGRACVPQAQVSKRELQSLGLQDTPATQRTKSKVLKVEKEEVPEQDQDRLVVAKPVSEKEAEKRMQQILEGKKFMERAPTARAHRPQPAHAPTALWCVCVRAVSIGQRRYEGYEDAARG